MNCITDKETDEKGEQFAMNMNERLNAITKSNTNKVSSWNQGLKKLKKNKWSSLFTITTKIKSKIVVLLTENAVGMSATKIKQLNCPN